MSNEIEQHELPPDFDDDENKDEQQMFVSATLPPTDDIPLDEDDDDDDENPFGQTLTPTTSRTTLPDHCQSQLRTSLKHDMSSSIDENNTLTNETQTLPSQVDCLSDRTMVNTATTVGKLVVHETNGTSRKHSPMESNIDISVSDPTKIGEVGRN
jgi:hypothetical protein